MSAGLPGFGLGGVFYILLIVWMVARAVGRQGKAENRSSRWAFIAKMVAIGIVMVGVLLGQSVLIHAAFKTAVVYFPEMANSTVPSGSFLLLIAAVPFVLLILLIVCLHVLRLSLPSVTTKLGARGVDLANATQSP